MPTVRVTLAYSARTFVEKEIEVADIETLKAKTDEIRRWAQEKIDQDDYALADPDPDIMIDLLDNEGRPVSEVELECSLPLSYSS